MQVPSTWEAIALDQGEQVPVWHREQVPPREYRGVSWQQICKCTGRVACLGKAAERATEKGTAEVNPPPPSVRLGNQIRGYAMLSDGKGLVGITRSVSLAPV